MSFLVLQMTISYEFKLTLTILCDDIGCLTVDNNIITVCVERNRLNSINNDRIGSPALSR